MAKKQSMMVNKGFKFAIMAGFTAASASVFAKLAFGEDIQRLVCASSQDHQDHDSEHAPLCYNVTDLIFKFEYNLVFISIKII